jgi:cyanophycinase
MSTKGTLLIIGGAEDKAGYPPDIIEQSKEFIRYEILRELVPHSSSKKIELITTGSEFQDEVIKTYQKAFHKLGYDNLDFIPIKERAECFRQEYIDRAQEAGVVFFTGGNQFRLSTILGGTPFIDIIKQRYFSDPDFVVAGTSDYGWRPY